MYPPEDYLLGRSNPELSFPAAIGISRLFDVSKNGNEILPKLIHREDGNDIAVFYVERTRQELLHVLKSHIDIENIVAKLWTDLRTESHARYGFGLYRHQIEALPQWRSGPPVFLSLQFIDRRAHHLPTSATRRPTGFTKTTSPSSKRTSFDLSPFIA